MKLIITNKKFIQNKCQCCYCWELKSTFPLRFLWGSPFGSLCGQHLKFSVLPICFLWVYHLPSAHPCFWAARLPSEIWSSPPSFPKPYFFFYYKSCSTELWAFCHLNKFPATVGQIHYDTKGQESSLSLLIHDSADIFPHTIKSYLRAMIIFYTSCLTLNPVPYVGQTLGKHLLNRCAKKYVR